jgi:hypothetical protein
MARDKDIVNIPFYLLILLSLLGQKGNKEAVGRRIFRP